MKATKAITNREDIIDSRDIIARIEELRSDRDDLSGDELDSWTEDYGDELAALESVAEDADGCSDWKYGEALIRDSYFATYAKELASDIGEIDRNASWPLRHIDWEAAADELKSDYTEIDFDGVSYWIRS